MNALLSPGQPGSQNLLVATGLHAPWGSLPASIAPEDNLKPALFRKKGTVCRTLSLRSLEKALGKNNKSNHEATG